MDTEGDNWSLLFHTKDVEIREKFIKLCEIAKNSLMVGNRRQGIVLIPQKIYEKLNFDDRISFDKSTLNLFEYIEVRSISSSHTLAQYLSFCLMRNLKKFSFIFLFGFEEFFSFDKFDDDSHLNILKCLRDIRALNQSVMVKIMIIGVGIGKITSQNNIHSCEEKAVCDCYLYFKNNKYAIEELGGE